MTNIENYRIVNITLDLMTDVCYCLKNVVLKYVIQIVLQCDVDSAVKSFLHCDQFEGS